MKSNFWKDWDSQLCKAKNSRDLEDHMYSELFQYSATSGEDSDEENNNVQAEKCSSNLTLHEFPTTFYQLVSPYFGDLSDHEECRDDLMMKSKLQSPVRKSLDTSLTANAETVEDTAAQEYFDDGFSDMESITSEATTTPASQISVPKRSMIPIRKHDTAK